MLLLPSPWIVALPAISYCFLDSLRLTQMTLACGMRSSQDARLEQFNIECLTHALPPM